MRYFSCAFAQVKALVTYLPSVIIVI